MFLKKLSTAVSDSDSSCKARLHVILPGCRDIGVHVGFKAAPEGRGLTVCANRH